MLKTKVKASSVTNLTDARYFAAWEIEWLGFNFDPGSEAYIQPQAAQAIKEWIDGVKVAGEFGLQSFEEILTAVDMLELDGVQIGRFGSIETLKALHENEVPILLETVVEDAGKLREAAAAFPQTAPYVEAFILNFDKNGISWGALQGRPVEQLGQLCREYPVILSLDFNPETLQEALESLNLYGINVRGGEEEKTGFKSFDELDELFEALEIQE
ncbi:MAG: N-(5'-phosphoribosyl)anthranilate isomerase [Lewinellaceae bacterium]|nr:N-(5'-phosphoribosyl)anthranilate isomerase [Lewinellaceae bacterium]MCB9288186.1 N-(5'-phosphoribosyl)anthranilate isomerase [Lewinellaceae bacterium]